MRKIMNILFVPVIATFLFPCICYSTIITVEFTAEVTETTSKTDELEGKVQIGDKITGTYTYDTSILSPFAYNLTQASYYIDSPPSGITAKVGDFTFQTNIQIGYLDINVFDTAFDPNLGVYDTLEISSPRNIMFYDKVQNTEMIQVDINILLKDIAKDPIGMSNPMIALISTDLPAEAPNLAYWPTKEIEISVYTIRKPNLSFQIKGRLTSATLIYEPQKIIYVDDDASGINDGSSWKNAYTFLQDAIADANISDKPVEIHIADGIYQPDMGQRINPGDREATFQLMEDVRIKGGYAGLSGPLPDMQNFDLYKTFLSGDLNSDDETDFANRNDNSYHVVSANDVDESALIEGVIITSGNADGLAGNNPDPSYRRNDHTINGGGIYAYNSHPTIKSCAIKDNFAYGYGGGIYLSGTSRLFNCNFSGNKAGDTGGAICTGKYVSIGSTIVLKNCLIQGNFANTGGVFGIYKQYQRLFNIYINCSIVDNRSNIESYIYPDIYSTIIWNNNPLFQNIKNLPRNDTKDFIPPNYSSINTDPLFAAPGKWNDNKTPANKNDDYWIEGDYHLKSQAGRWNPNTQSWVQDDVTSPCIDEGYPNSPIGLEPFPNGGYINLGAYGGTNQASKSYFGKPICETIITGDINGDCKVDETDMEILMLHWLENDIEY